jgi:hypothetical protein
MGPILKGAGAIAFVLDYALRGSSASFLLFAAFDGTLGGVTLWALLRTRPVSTKVGPTFRSGASAHGHRPT